MHLFQTSIFDFIKTLYMGNQIILILSLFNVEIKNKSRKYLGDMATRKTNVVTHFLNLTFTPF